MNALRSSQGIATLGTHSVLTAKAQAWAQHMADSGCLCHSNLPDGVTVGWRKLSENIGRGPSVASIDTALVNSPLHYANMVDGAVHWVGVAYGNGQMYVAEVFMDGDAPPAENPYLLFDWHGRGIAARTQGGFWVLQGLLVPNPSVAAALTGPAGTSPSPSGTAPTAGCTSSMASESCGPSGQRRTTARPGSGGTSREI